jgi:hypothetical protein
MLKPALSSANGHPCRKRQLDSLRTFLLGCSGRAITSAGDHRWRHLSVHGRRAGSCADSSVVLAVEELGDQLGAEPARPPGPASMETSWMVSGWRQWAGDLGGGELAAAVVAQPASVGYPPEAGPGHQALIAATISSGASSWM